MKTRETVKRKENSPYVTNENFEQEFNPKLK